MSDLVEFLLARIAEDEQHAKMDGIHWSDCARFIAYELGGCSCDCGAEERFLAECEAKRRIVEAHPHQDTTEWDQGLWCLACQWDFCCDQPGTNTLHDRGTYPCPTLRALAAVYADHLDYDEAWRL